MSQVLSHLIFLNQRKAVLAEKGGAAVHGNPGASVQLRCFLLVNGGIASLQAVMLGKGREPGSGMTSSSDSMEAAQHFNISVSAITKLPGL